MSAYQPVGFSRDGKWLASASRYGEITLYETTGWKAIRRWPGNRFGTASLAFSPDGKSLAIGGQWKTRIWDTATGKQLRDLEGANYTWSVAYSADGRMLVAAGSNNEIHLWEVATGKLRDAFPSGLTIAPQEIAFSPDGEILVAVSSDGIGVWDVVTGQKLRHLRETSGSIGGLAFSPDGKRIATGSSDATLLVWDVESCRKPRPRTKLPVAEVEALWNALRSEGDQAFWAIRKLIVAPDQSVALFAKRIVPVPRADHAAHCPVAS